MFNKTEARPLLLALVLAVGVVLAGEVSRGANPPVAIQVDVAAGRHAIDGRIYGVAWGSKAQVADLNATLNRHGGNPTSRYNWMLDADNRGKDYYFESLGYDGAQPGAYVDAFIGDTKAGGAEPMITIPMTDWVAKLGPMRSPLSSFSIAKYGPQTDHDPNGFGDAGNGIATATGKPIAGNDPNDANVPNSVDFQMGWVRHLVEKWGASRNGGLSYYLLDNEPSIWHGAHRDIQPVGLKMDDYMKKAIDYAGAIKAIDPDAKVAGPNEWGWNGYFESGYDQQYGAAHNFASFPDKVAHGGMEYLPWILDQLHQYDVKNGKRLLDLFTVHFYPQGGEFGGLDETSAKTQLLRNRSTRELWDPNYTSESWIADKVNLIPRLKEWVNRYYPGTPIGLTEYNWGAENNIGGATAQADVLGILGREGVDAAARWTAPDPTTPTYKAIQMYRNYDGKKSTFGDVGVSAVGPDPDDLAVFAAQRSADDAVTVMVVNKVLNGDTPVTVQLSNFAGGDAAQEWQLTSANAIAHLADVPLAGGGLSTTVPAQSITLFVVPKAAAPAPAVAPTFTSSAIVAPDTAAPGGAVTITATVTGVQGTLDNGIVDVELYDAKGNKIAQKSWPGQSFTPNHSETYAYPLNAPADEGVYTVDVGVFNSDWSQNPHWNNNAGTLTVKRQDAGMALRGDLNGDGAFTLADVILALQVTVGNDLPTPQIIAAGDLDGDGTVDLKDVIALLRLIVGV